MRYMLIDGDLDGSTILPTLDHPSVIAIVLGEAETRQRLQDDLQDQDASIVEGRGASGNEIHVVLGDVVLRRAMPIPKEDMPEIPADDLMNGFFFVASSSSESGNWSQTYVRLSTKGMIQVSLSVTEDEHDSMYGVVQLMDQDSGMKSAVCTMRFEHARYPVRDSHLAAEAPMIVTIPAPAQDVANDFDVLLGLMLDQARMTVEG